MMEMRSYAVSDTLMKNNQRGGHCKLVTLCNEIINSRESCDKNLGATSLKAAEAMTMLDMLSFMQNHVSSGA